MVKNVTLCESVIAGQEERYGVVEGNWRFFFSSRRRHTRFDCDWSSDVCSSDLPPPTSATPHQSSSCTPPLFLHHPRRTLLQPASLVTHHLPARGPRDRNKPHADALQDRKSVV